MKRNAKGFGSSGLQQGDIEDGSKFSEGRFPANILFDEIASKLLDQQSGQLKSGAMNQHIEGVQGTVYGKQYPRQVSSVGGKASEGGASRFFKVTKFSNKELEELRFIYSSKAPGREKQKGVEEKNTHETVKSIDLMMYLVRLVTPQGGLCLDIFNGSGSTGVACKLLGMNYVGIEQDKDHCKVARERIIAWTLRDLVDPEPKKPVEVLPGQNELFS